MIELVVASDGPGFAAFLKGAATQGLLRAATVVQEQAKENLSIPAPPASKLGESPHKRTNRRIEPTDMSMADGADGPEAMIEISSRVPRLNYHEQNGRPWLKPAALQTQTEQANAVMDATLEQHD